MSEVGSRKSISTFAFGSSHRSFKSYFAAVVPIQSIVQLALRLYHYSLSPSPMEAGAAKRRLQSGR